MKYEYRNIEIKRDIHLCGLFFRVCSDMSTLSSSSSARGPCAAMNAAMFCAVVVVVSFVMIPAMIDDMIFNSVVNEVI